MSIRSVLPAIAGLVFAFNGGGPFCRASAEIEAAAGRTFTVKDDIALAYFNDPANALETRGAKFSRDGAWAAVCAERGTLTRNRVEAELRFYRIDSLRKFVNANDAAVPPEPAWKLSQFAAKEGLVIQEFRWLDDSSGLVIEARADTGRARLFLADLAHRMVVPMTSEDQDVTAFDARSATRYVFAVRSTPPASFYAQQDAAGIDLTGLGYDRIAYPGILWRFADRSLLWAAADGPAKQLVDPATGDAIVLYLNGTRNLKMSPDGRTLVTAVCVPEVPKDWETRYPPALPSVLMGIHAGGPDLTVPLGVLNQAADEFALIDTRTGKMTMLTGTPTAQSAGWTPGYATATWSQSGDVLVLPGAFRPDSAPGSEPYVMVYDRKRRALEDVDVIPRRQSLGHDKAYNVVLDLAFDSGKGDRLIERYFHYPDNVEGHRIYSRMSDGTWRVASDGPTPPPELAPLRLTVQEDLNLPQVVVASDAVSGKSRVVWDPNPQLRDFALGDASVYRWKDGTGLKWIGGLYRPATMVAGRRYPLVIQTHGFWEHAFRTSGLWSTAFSARALASAGILVLQVPDWVGRLTPEEGPANVRGYEAAVAQLTSQGLVDASRVGIIGFSRSVYYTLTALTTSKLRFRAASITDGTTGGYLEYSIGADLPAGFEAQMESLVGGSPFGATRELWLQRSPSFNMDKVNAPLLIAGTRYQGASVLKMWEPYATLRYLHKPVDFMELNSDEHVFTNPAVRLASQGTNVDWFRFWLQDYEDPDPIKAGQYARWRKLKELRDADLKKQHEEQLPNQLSR